MIADLKPYSAMRNPGVPWLGEVPAHWALRRIRTVARILNGATPSSNTLGYWNGEIVWITPEDLGALNNRYIGDSARKITRRGYDSCGTSLAPAGSLAISTRAPIGHVGILSSPACVNQGCRLLVPNESVKSAYFYHILEAGRSELRSLGQGTTFAELSRGKLAEFYLALPPIAEQTAIVRFLDHADRRIRRYIRAKQKLIALLEEQKQAIIHQAVTGQIDVRTGEPYPTYKDSGVEWLGEVPEHWEVVALRYLAIKFGSGITPRGGGTIYKEIGVPFLRSQNIHFDGIRLENVARIPEDLHATLARTHVKPGDVLLNITGASIGRVCAVPVDFEGANVNQHVCIIRPKIGKLLPEFLAAFLSTLGMQREIRFEQNGASREGLTLQAIRSFMVAMPTVSDQQRIMDEVRGKTAQFEIAAHAAENEICLLREYRTRLIADVVTGKLDVREATAALPEVDPFEVEDPLDAPRSEADFDELDPTLEEANA